MSSEKSLDEKLSELENFIVDNFGIPLEIDAVAALLESKGLRDVDAIDDFNEKNIFFLAKTVFTRIQNSVKAPKEKLNFEWLNVFQSFFFFINQFISGSLLTIPILGQVILLVVFRYSLWASMDFTEQESSLVAIGTIVSFLITGGLVQSIGRQGVLYSSQGNFYLLNKVLHLFLKIGLIFSLVFSSMLLLLDLIYDLLSLNELIIILIYFNLLSLMWVILSILYVLKKMMALLVTTVVGIIGVYLFRSVLGYDLYIAHGAGLLVSCIYGYSCIYRTIRSSLKEIDERFLMSQLPKGSIIWHSISPYFLFGVLYFLFLFLDRMVGWSKTTHPNAFFLWFRTPYELGLDWGITVLFITFAYLNYVVYKFNFLLIPIQKAYTARQLQQQKRKFKNFFIIQLIIIVLIGAVSVICAYRLGIYLRDHSTSVTIQNIFKNKEMYKVFWISSISYVLMTIGQLGSLFYFSLSHPSKVNVCIFKAICVNFVVGVFLSRYFTYDFAVYGLLAGSLYYAFYMIKNSWYLFNNIDYYYYSAY